MLEEVKAYLKITWNDEDTELESVINRSKSYLEALSGTVLDFETNLEARGLLLDRCRYVYNNASEYFEENFQKEILRLQLIEGVKALEV